MSRYALLIFNEALAPPGTKWKDLDEKLLAAFHSKMDRILNCPHEDYEKFKIVPVFTMTSKSAKEKIENFFVKDYKEEDLLLFYYVGHAVKEEGQPLRFLFKDSFKPKSDNKSLYSPDININKTVSVADLQASIRNTTAKKIILILDCCYSGIASEEIKFAGPGRSIFVISSVTGASLAVTHTKGDIGSGAFSISFLEGIENGQAAKGLMGRIALGDAFSYARNWVQKKYPFQKPKTYGDATLADELIYLLTDSFLEGRLSNLPTTSIYNKIGKLLELVKDNPQKNPGEYYSAIIKRKPSELLVKVKGKGNKIDSKILSMQTFNKHLGKCKEFGLITGLDSIKLTDRGQRMFENDCERYNSYLRKGLLEYLLDFGISLQDIESKIFELIKGGRSSAIRPLWESFIISDRKIGFYDFRYLIKLLAVIRVIRYTNKRYYLPSR